MLKKILFADLLAVALLFSGCAKDKDLSGEAAKARNVILMIGDGMGQATVYAAMTFSESRLNIERCPVTGLQKSFSADNYITDSGAASTAIATGTKTNNGSVGVDPYGKPLKSIIEIVEEKGFSTGLVSTSALTHATPASFFAHQKDRNNYEKIASDFLKSDVDVIIGGGYDHFAKRTDGHNLIDSLKLKDYDVASTIEETLKSSSSRIAGFTAAIHNPYRLKGRGDMLPSATSKAISALGKNKTGFFLMVEGSEIDWAAHANSADTLVDETLDFDRAVGVALDYAQHDGNTLVLITADHETGGVTVTGGNLKEHTAVIKFSTTGHTAVMVPVYAFGPGSENFRGIYDNTDIILKIKAALQIE